MEDNNMLVEVNCSTGEVKTRELTPEEIEAKELAAIEFATMQEELNAMQNQKENAKRSAIQKLVSLGLTEEEAIALSGN